MLFVWFVSEQSGDTCVHLSAYQGSPTIMEMLLGYDGESFGYRCVNAKNEVGVGHCLLFAGCRGVMRAMQRE